MPFTLGGSPVSGGDIGLSALGGLAGGLGSAPTVTTQNGTTQQYGSTTGESNFNDFLNSLVNAIQNTSGASNSQANSTGTTSTTANLSPEMQALLGKITQGYSKLNAPSLQGYQQGQVQGINNNSQLQQQSVDNVMAARGLSSSPVAGNAATGIDTNRVNQINQFNQQLPLVQNQLEQNNLGAASGFLSTLPGITGTTGINNNNTSGVNNSVSQQSNQTTTGQSTGGTGYNTSNNSGTTYNSANSTSGQKGSAAGAVGGIASILASLFSDKRLKEEIKEIPSDKAAARILALRPSTWKWRGQSDESKDTGLIAQDLQKVMPELVHKDPAGSGLLKVNYAGLISELVGAIQHVNSKIEVGAN